MLYACQNGKLIFVSKLDVPSEQKSSTVSAMERFRSIDRNALNENSDVNLSTQHQNAITQIMAHTTKPGGVIKFSTSGTDGMVALWDLKTLESQVASIKVH